ncbi:MAG: glycoside hydrolase family 2 TIM barrel-domain containing protein [Candidatus Marinimicrobia bacterium]|nr:glycoside hydrolase family 2 TIM barrel-domain containing protein [Candidatus Neomarinimicrobiota bacterium]
MGKTILTPLLLMVLLSSCIPPDGNTSHSSQIVPLSIVLDPELARQTINLNEGWRYLEQSLEISQVGEVSQSEWVDINLPHTWNALDATDNNPGYRRSASWYRKLIQFPGADKKWILHFEGVNISSKVYLNGQEVGGHVGGYVGFDVDISTSLKPGKINELLVWVDNSVNPNIIPSQKSDFFIYGGITRDVWLKVLPKVHLNQLHISTPQVSVASANTSIAMEVINDLNHSDEIAISIQLIDPQGDIALSSRYSERLEAGLNTYTFVLPNLTGPNLWSPDNPDLYTVVIQSSVAGYKDIVKEKIGYRWFEFQEHGPFFLNGERLLLRGTHRHEEWAGYGNAMPNALHRRDMEMIKEIGANFVRLAHYPQDPEIYKACDELGLLVWDELPWCRGGMGGTVWKSNTERLWREQINQNFNHPSIILWSVGNELYWQPDFEGGGNIDSLVTYVHHLNDLTHALDPYRLTTMRKFYDGADVTDVFSPSIWAGWYSGMYKTFETAITKANKKYKHFFHMEYGGASHLGRHTEYPITGEGFVKADEWDEKSNMINVKRVSASGDWSENYIVDLFDWHLMISETSPWLTGNAQWAFKDFGTPLRPENAIPYINQKGLVDREGNPKDAYYVFKSYWTTDPKFCYIESHTWTERFGKKNETREISVFSNCETVEFYHNDVSMGRHEKELRAFPASGFHWDVNFEAGPNTLIAVGYTGTEEVSRDSLIVNFTVGKPSKPETVALSQTVLDNGTILIEARVVDKKGGLCPQYNKRVYFDIDGPGDLLRYQGTPTGSDVIEFASGKASIEFLPGASGISTIEARTQDFKGSYLRITTP